MRQPSPPTNIDLGLALTPILYIVALLPQNEQIGAQLSTYDTLQRFLVLGAILYDCSVYSRVPRHNMTNAWLYGSVCNMEEGGGGGHLSGPSMEAMMRSAVARSSDLGRLR